MSPKPFPPEICFFFFQSPPSMPNRKSPPPPVLFIKNYIKAFPMPTSPPGLVLVSVKKMVRPPNFFQIREKAKKMNY
jgi:hypothetical protein